MQAYHSVNRLLGTVYFLYFKTSPTVTQIVRMLGGGFYDQESGRPISKAL